jgi:hypothetical protein
MGKHECLMRFDDVGFCQLRTRDLIANTETYSYPAFRESYTEQRRESRKVEFALVVALYQFEQEMEEKAEPLRFIASLPLTPLLGSPSEEPQDDSCGDPIVVLMKIGAERGPVIVDIEQTDVHVSGRMDVYSAARFNRKTVLRSRVTADPADGGVCARSTDQGFSERGCAPSISPAAEEARPEVISIEEILGSIGRHEAIAAVRDELQPRFYIVAKRPHGAV